jgi:hypothetical protein
VLVSSIQATPWSSRRMWVIAAVVIASSCSVLCLPVYRSRGLRAA